MDQKETGQKMELRTVVTWIVVLGTLLIIAGVGLIYLGAVAKALPTGFGVLSTVDPTVREIILIIVLAVIAVIAWAVLPKSRRRGGS